MARVKALRKSNFTEQQERQLTCPEGACVRAAWLRPRSGVEFTTQPDAKTRQVAVSGSGCSFPVFEFGPRRATCGGHIWHFDPALISCFCGAWFLPPAAAAASPVSVSAAPNSTAHKVGITADGKAVPFYRCFINSLSLRIRNLSPTS